METPKKFAQYLFYAYYTLPRDNVHKIIHNIECCIVSYLKAENTKSVLQLTNEISNYLSLPGYNTQLDSDIQEYINNKNQ